MRSFRLDADSVTELLDSWPTFIVAPLLALLFAYLGITHLWGRVCAVAIWEKTRVPFFRVFRQSAFDHIARVNPRLAANVLWFSSAVLCPVALHALRASLLVCVPLTNEQLRACLPDVGLRRRELAQIFSDCEEDIRHERFPQTDFRC